MARLSRFADVELASIERGLDLAHHKSLKIRREQPGASLVVKEDRTHHLGSGT